MQEITLTERRVGNAQAEILCSFPTIFQISYKFKLSKRMNFSQHTRRAAYVDAENANAL